MFETFILSLYMSPKKFPDILLPSTDENIFLISTFVFASILLLNIESPLPSPYLPFIVQPKRILLIFASLANNVSINEDFFIKFDTSRTLSK